MRRGSLLAVESVVSSIATTKVKVEGTELHILRSSLCVVICLEKCQFKGGELTCGETIGEREFALTSVW